MSSQQDLGYMSPTRTYLSRLRPKQQLSVPAGPTDAGKLVGECHECLNHNSWESCPDPEHPPPLQLERRLDNRFSHRRVHLLALRPRAPQFCGYRRPRAGHVPTSVTSVRIWAPGPAKTGFNALDVLVLATYIRVGNGSPPDKGKETFTLAVTL